ncbi:ParA family protein [Comamonas kerstersii]|uniref:ParA family protein n=1 Tax=Comamonas kerstersii TaxID=225992 RepID=A0A6A1R0V1_9BURK|nr:ParA family protein [Comamonas kerstersii]KAB0585890.1 ParA family protein [Comamonas kerstersii]
MFTITVVSTKGGVGKTTLAANLGGLLRDIGLRVLLIDADVQPSLTRYYALEHEAAHGLTQLIRSGVLSPDCISQCQLPPASYDGKLDKMPQSLGGVLHLVRSDTRDGKLQDWMSSRMALDMLMRLNMPLKHPNVTSAYDVVLIDTQGAIGHLQDAAVNAADQLLVPVSPDIVSAREFLDGTISLLDRHECTANVGMKMPPMKAVLTRTEKTKDCNLISDLVREQFIEMRGRVSMLSTVVPAAVAYRKAATSQVPVHWVDPLKQSDVMHKLLWELIPSVAGMCASNHPDFIDLNAPHDDN